MRRHKWKGEEEKQTKRNGNRAEQHEQSKKGRGIKKEWI